MSVIFGGCCAGAVKYRVRNDFERDWGYRFAAHCLSYAIGQKISRPIREITDVMEVLSSGDAIKNIENKIKELSASGELNEQADMLRRKVTDFLKQVKAA